MSVLQQWQSAQASPEVIVNENFGALEHMAVYGKSAATTAGLTWGYLSGRWGGFAVAAGTVTLTAGATNYLVVKRETGALSASAVATNWDNTDAYARVYKLSTGPATVTEVEDHRAGLAGVHGINGSGGGSPIGPTFAAVVPDATTARAVTLGDIGCYLRFTGAGAKSCTFDIAADFTTGQEVHIANRSDSGNVTLSATGITLNPPKGGTLKLEPGDTVTVKFVSSSIADVMGSTEAAP